MLHVTAQPPAVKELVWYDDIAEAKKDAATNHKSILIYFSGSDWCKPCIQLRENILNTEAYVSFAQQFMIMVQVDFPRLKKHKLSNEQTRHNERLAEQYNKQGIFPFIVILDSDGHVSGTTTYHEETPEEFIARIRSTLATK